MNGPVVRSALSLLIMPVLVIAGCGGGGEPADPAGTEGEASSASVAPEAAPNDPVSHRAEFLAIAERLENSTNEYLGTRRTRQVLDALAAGRVPPEQRAAVTVQLARDLLREGRETEAQRYIDEVVTVMGDATPAPAYMMRGLVYMRLAEVQNCIARHNAECCIFPLAGGGVHEVEGPAREAMLSFERFLSIAPRATSDDIARLRIAQWLLNVMAMALGHHPDQVPSEYLIPPSSFASQGDAPRFVDVAAELGIDTFNLCGGSITQDFDGDGDLDIVTSTYDPAGPLAYYVNLGDGTFEDRSDASGASDQLGGLNCVAADYDNDGDVDVYVLRGAWMHDDGQIRNSLLRYESDGTFTDVSAAAGLADVAYPTQAACWLDFDNDGDLDLYVANESRKGNARGRGGDFPAQLYSNNGDGTFTEVARAAGVTNDRYAKGVSAGDYDNDGDMDIYVSNAGRNSNGTNRLYRNDGNGTFTDVAQDLGVTEPEGRSFATWFFDYDNDGDLDLFVAAFECFVSDIALDYLGRAHQGTAPCLYRNDGGTFTDIAKDVGLARPWLPMGANFCDVDGDGYLDIYLATGDPGFETLTPNILLRNDGGARFLDVTTAAGLGHLQKGHGVAFADIDHDGDQDLYHQLGGFYRGDRYHNAMFMNPGVSDHHWLVVRLVGTESNSHGLGARVTVRLSTGSGPRMLHRAVGAVSSFGGSPFRQEIGLGDATGIESIEVWWPASGTRQTVTGVERDSAIRITEGADGFERVPYEAIPIRVPSGVSAG